MDRPVFDFRLASLVVMKATGIASSEFSSSRREESSREWAPLSFPCVLRLRAWYSHGQANFRFSKLSAVRVPD
jgi:hypothetical protein